MFINIHDRVHDLDIQLSGAVLETYKEEDIKDIDGTIHLCIFYKLRNGLRFEEEFASAADREDKMTLLDEWSSGGGGGSNLQVKSITVAENGSTVINPDSGYDGMSKVNLTTDVQPNLESKSITITENTTTTLTPTSGKDGMSSVSITTNVSSGGGHDWSELGYSQEPSTINDGYTYAKTIKDNWDPNLSSYNGKLSYDINLIYLPNLKINTANNTANFCQFCTSLEFCDELDFATSDTYAYMFYGCTALKTAPKINGKPTTMAYMFYECHYIKDVPIYDTSLTTNFGLMFYQCGKELTDQSLDNILQMCINATSYTGTKTLSTMSFVKGRVPATRWQSQQHYQDFIDAGWSIGY